MDLGTVSRPKETKPRKEEKKLPERKAGEIVFWVDFCFRSTECTILLTFPLIFSLFRFTDSLYGRKDIDFSIFF